MDPYSITAIVSSILKLARKCPVCGKHQIVPKNQGNETVICKHCGALIPPTHKS